MLNASLKAECFALSDVGLVREHNEDVFWMEPEKGLFILADGMGGHSGGEVAATLAVETLSKTLSSYKGPIESPQFKQAFEAANKVVFQEGQCREELSGMGTTLVCLYLQGENALFGHVGDSRLYLFRENYLRAITRDHSLLNELVDLGTMTQEEAALFPYKHILTKAVGTNAMIAATVASAALQVNDLFLLCSDGLTNFAEEKEIQNILQVNPSLPDQASALIALAKSKGGGDNITLILVKIR